MLRKAIALAAIAAGALAAAGCRAKTAKLADGVWAVSVGGVANYGIVLSEFGTVVVDSGPGPVAGTELSKLATRLTMTEVTYLVNTSPDPRRVLGNQEFKHAEIVAHEGVADEMEFRGELILRRLAEHPQAKALGAGECRIVPPTLTFESRTTLRMPDRTVVVVYPGGGPAPGASAVWLPGESILYAGEYVLVRTAPELGERIDLAAWVKSLEALEELASGDGARVVPGVGEVTGAECIRWMTDYIREMHDSVSELHASGASLEDTLKTVKMKKYNSWAGHRQRLSNNLTAAYRSLSARAARAARPAAGKE